MINLARRPDRIKSFLDQEWPYPVERIEAIDGATVAKPTWFKATVGAWGCLESHRLAWKALADSNEPYALILEDDALLRTTPGHLAKTITAFLSLNEPWDLFYLGGQYLDPAKWPATPWHPGFLRLRNVNRLHAYMVTREFAAYQYTHIHNTIQSHTTIPLFKQFPHHVDHTLQAYHRERHSRVYSPDQWLIDQQVTQSDIAANERGGSWKNSLQWTKLILTSTAKHADALTYLRCQPWTTAQGWLNDLARGDQLTCSPARILPLFENHWTNSIKNWLASPNLPLLYGTNIPHIMECLESLDIPYAYLFPTLTTPQIVEKIGLEQNPVALAAYEKELHDE